MGFYILLFVLLLLGYRILIYYDIFYPPPAKGILLYSISQKNYPLSPILYHPPTPPKFFPQPQTQLNNETPDEKFIPTRLVEMKRDSKRKRESGQRTHSRKGRVREKTRARVGALERKEQKNSGKIFKHDVAITSDQRGIFHPPPLRSTKSRGRDEPTSIPPLLYSSIPPATDY